MFELISNYSCQILKYLIEWTILNFHIAQKKKVYRRIQRINIIVFSSFLDSLLKMMPFLFKTCFLYISNKRTRNSVLYFLSFTFPKHFQVGFFLLSESRASLN